MMVLGADTHKRSHMVAAVAASTGELRGEKTVGVGARDFAEGGNRQARFALRSFGRDRSACRRMRPFATAPAAEGAQP